MSWRAFILAAPGKKLRLDAAAEGLQALGAEVVWIREGTLRHLHAALAAGVPRVVLASGMHVRDAHCRGWLRGLGIPLLVLDCGWFQRAGGPRDQHGYNQLGLDQLCWFPPKPWKPDPARFESLGVTLQSKIENRESKILLVLGQVPGDSQHHLSATQQEVWLGEHAAPFLARGWTIRYRAHPSDPQTSIGLIHDRSQGCTLAQDFALATHVLTFNSTAGLEALVAGLPVACSPSAHYAGLTPGTPALLDHCRRLAWAQWTCAELRTGEPLRFMDRWGKFLPRPSEAGDEPSVASAKEGIS